MTSVAPSDINREALSPSFDGTDPSLAPGPTRLSYRKAYYHLVNVEEHPEVLPLAYDLVARRLGSVAADTSKAVAPPATAADIGSSLSGVLARVAERRTSIAYPWRRPSEDLTRRQAFHYCAQYLPTALVDGCWLQCGLRVSTAHTPVGASLTGLYQHQVRAFVADPGRHFVADYRAVYTRLGAPLEEVSSHSFSQREDFHEGSFPLPIFLLCLAQFTRTFPAEILGLNLAWQFMDLSAFGPELIRDTCKAYGLPPYGDELTTPEHLELGRTMARDAVVQYLEGVDQQGLGDAWKRVLRGVDAGLEAWKQWLDATGGSAPTGAPDPRQEMIDLLWRKAPHAHGYHANRRLGARKIDEHLDPKSFDGSATLDALAKSPWVKPGMSAKSALVNRLVAFGGPMLAVFSPVELEIMQKWIDSLPPKDTPAASGDGPAPMEAAPMPSPVVAAHAAPLAPTVRDELYVEGRGWDAGAYRERSKRLYGKCTVRELYHYLINLEFHPDILPVAERFAADRLERSAAAMWKGERPIPSRRYDPVALEQWVYNKHREQVESYRPPDVRPEAPKDAFIEATVQLAPLILIDGGWLQGMASPALIHTTVGRMLFHVLVEELGEGKVKEHHANVYRNLLSAMGEQAPPVETWAFARWSRLLDSSFDVPALWLSISCFPRHFQPEILGLNLAVELAGVGGPYMEARDTLKRFRLPTTFVDVHNAADNVSVGHAAWAMNAIKRYMDEVAERDGPHNVDRIWHRVWAGARATLPQMGRMRLLGHRIRKRFFGGDLTQVPLIFPS